MSRSHECERCTHECVRHGLGEAQPSSPRRVQRPVCGNFFSLERNCSIIPPSKSQIGVLMIGKFQVVLLLAASSTVALRAQEVSAGITGRVADPSGGSIVNAKVAAKDLDRGTDWPTTTNEDGIYAFPRIPPGRYELRIEAPGFKTYINPEVALEVNQRARVDVHLEGGAVSE